MTDRRFHGQRARSLIRPAGLPDGPWAQTSSGGARRAKASGGARSACESPIAAQRTRRGERRRLSRPAARRRPTLWTHSVASAHTKRNPSVSYRKLCNRRQPAPDHAPAERKRGGENTSLHLHQRVHGGGEAKGDTRYGFFKVRRDEAERERKVTTS